MTKKVLVVEDNDLNRKLFSDLLRAHKFEVDALADGRKVIDTARDFSPDLIIMDIQLPHIGGLELIEALKADTALKAIPVMAVTAYAGKGDEDRIREAGAESYVSKPVSIQPFMQAVNALL
ncbi:response regulator [Sphingorhabdus sp. Alg239-R122]|uniref:response regulator n=1 Tax=Sphingorhabdus sp. Alg239-R122 TaxID=2305989 RepID=UPI0013DA08E4|nr:response regulator [Sphingorhabdus sp. Alg239-R122]